MLTFSIAILVDLPWWLQSEENKLMSDELLLYSRTETRDSTATETRKDLDSIRAAGFQSKFFLLI